MLFRLRFFRESCRRARNPSRFPSGSLRSTYDRTLARLHKNSPLENEGTQSKPQTKLRLTFRAGSYTPGTAEGPIAEENMAVKDTSVALIASSQIESERQSPLWCDGRTVIH